MNLNEVYDDLTFSKEEVISSLEVVRIETKNLDKKDIIDNLNNEFLGIGIMFLDNDSYNEKSNHAIYPNEGIVNSEYNKDKQMTYVYINNTFIDNFINKKYNLLSNGIIASAMHEDTHKQQIMRSNDKAKGLNKDVDINTKEGFQTYLENDKEIDAHAREVAIYLYNLGYSGSEIGKMLNENNPELIKNAAYEKYWNFFGITTKIDNVYQLKDKDTIHRLKVWKRFLSRIIAYLITTNKYKFTVKYEDALKKLKDIENKIIGA